MKYAFSTLGCPTWKYDEIVATAKDLGYDGVEIRGIANELYAPKIKVFAQNITNNLSKLNGLELPMLTSNCCIATGEDIEQNMTEAKEYIVLADKIGAKFVRVMSSNVAMIDKGDFALAVNNYKALCDFASNYNVVPLIETNGMFADTSVLQKFMLEVNKPNMGILWDIHHPYRYNNESIDKTIANIGQYIKYVHIKDSIRQGDITIYKMLGHGDLPLKEAITALKSINYDGYVTLEWVKRWNPDLEAPGIVFAHFINKIKELTEE